MGLPEQMFPLVRKVALEVMEGPLSEEALERLNQDILALDGESLRDCVRELIYLATVLEEAGHAKTAAPLFSLVESRAVITSLDRANANRLAIGGESVVMAAKKFARFSTGAEAVRNARKAQKGKPLSELGPQRFVGLRLR